MLRINYIIFSVVFLLAKNTIHPLGMIINGNEPVPFATIKNIKTNNWSISNDQGIFNVPSNTQYGDTLIINRIGFKKQTTVASSNIIVNLKHELITFDEIIVETNKNTNLQLPQSLLSRQTLAMQLSGSTLRTYGSDAGITQIAINGGRTTDAKIIFDGIDLTSPQNGLADLSQLPKQFFGFINKNDNQYLMEGSGATDGVIKLTPWNYPKKIDYTIEEDGSQSIMGHYSISTTSINLNFAIGRHNSTGMHPVWYNSELIQRSNQQFDQKFTGLRIKIINKSWFGELSLWRSLNDRGINETIWSPNIEAFRKDTLFIFNSSLTRLFTKGSLQLFISHRHTSENYVDPTRAINSNHANNSNSYYLKSSIKINQQLLFRLKTGLINESIKSSEAGQRNRNLYFLAPSISANNINGFNLISALRLDLYSDFGKITTLSSKLTKAIFPWINLSSACGTSFRAPTFNDLYWTPGGNPDLNAERSSFQEIEIYGHINKMDYKVKIKQIYSKDLIEWIPKNNFFQPNNIAKSQRNILKISTIIPLNNIFQINGNLSRLWSMNLSTNTDLRYAPDWIGNLKLNINYWGWQINTSLHIISQQIHLYGYPNHTIIGPNYISFLEVKAPPIISEKMQIKCSVSNLLNKEIISIYGYPEPSRKFQVSLSYQLK